MSTTAVVVVVVVVVGILVLAFLIRDPFTATEIDQQERKTLADLERRRKAAGKVK